MTKATHSYDGPRSQFRLVETPVGFQVEQKDHASYEWDKVFAVTQSNIPKPVLKRFFDKFIEAQKELGE